MKRSILLILCALFLGVAHTLPSLRSAHVTSLQLLDEVQIETSTAFTGRKTCPLGPTYPSAPNNNMSTCCWYADDTCCSPYVASLLLPMVEELEQQLLSQAFNNKSDECYLAMANTLCFWCSPDLEQYLDFSNPYNITIRICQSFCDAGWAVCKDDFQALAKAQGYPIPTTADDFCRILFTTEESDEGADHAPYVIVFEIESDNQQCFVGRSTLEIACSDCVYQSPKPTSPCPKEARLSAKGPDNKPNTGKLVGVILLALLGVGVLAGVAVVITLLVRRAIARRAAAAPYSRVDTFAGESLLDDQM